MILRISVLVILLSVAFSECASAQGVPDDIMINSLRCEAGRIGKKLEKAKLPLDKMMVVTWKDAKTNSGGFGGGFKFPIFDLGFSGELSREQLDELGSDGLTFNLHPDNAAVCAGFKKRIIKEGIGAYRCLGETKYPTLSYAISNKAGSATCHYKVTLVQKLSGSLKVPVWGLLEAGPSGSYGNTSAYDMVIAAPPKKGG